MTGSAGVRRPMRYLAVDLGAKRTGLAVGDAATGLVTPVRVLEIAMSARRGEALLDAIAEAARDHLPDAPDGAVVVGLPVNMDGTEGVPARLTREFGARLGQRTGHRVHFQDERLTSSEADWAMAGSGLTRKRKKARRDALAAGAILRDFLAAQKDQEGGAGSAG